MAQYAMLIYAHDSAHAPGATPQDTESSDRHSDELADLLSRTGRTSEAADCYRQAFDLAANEAERAFLAGQIADHTRQERR